MLSQEVQVTECITCVIARTAFSRSSTYSRRASIVARAVYSASTRLRSDCKFPPSLDDKIIGNI